MIKIACASCKKSVEIADFLSAATQPCPHCGRLVIGGGDPQTPSTTSPPWVPDRPPGPFLRLLNLVCGDNPLGLRTLLFGTRVVLSRREIDHLPAVCMRCGAPAERAVRKSFVDPRASNWSVMTNTPDRWSANALLRDPNNQAREPWVTIEIPLCRVHAHHFVLQNVSIYLSLTGFFGGAVWMALTSDRVQTAFVAMPIFIVSAVLLGWYLMSRGIRAGHFFDEYVEIWGVSPAFVQALVEHRAARLNKDTF
jgi:hypothetical protein